VSFGNKIANLSRRRSKREEVSLAGSALAVARSRSVAIFDLSSEGAGMAARDLPPPGEDVLFVVGPVDRMAKVVWRSETHCGIQFDDPLCDSDVARMKKDAAWASVTGWVHGLALQ
jgi:hypothetical protein